MKIVVLVVPVVQEDLVVLMVLVTVVALEDLVPNDVLPVVNKDVLQVLVVVLKNVLLELKVVPVVLVGQDVLVELKDVPLEENNAVLQVNMVPVLQMQNALQKCADREDLVVLAFMENQEDVTGNIDL
uniref:Secreted protein n=1 Tax=Acrobeloides nanus TaxID=290746 RepID=A0A914DTE1_9BILA